jgi:hypothetical protein
LLRRNSARVQSHSRSIRVRTLALYGRHTRFLTSVNFNYWLCKHESESELRYDWRFTVNQFDLATGPLRPVILFSNWTFAVIVIM